MRAEDRLLGEHGRDMLPGAVADREEFDQQDGEQHRERIVAAGFDFERRADARAQPQALGMNRKNTAAASVEATTAPTSSASIQLKPSTNFATGAVSAAVSSTPTVASVTAGPEHAAEGRKARAQAAVEQDQRERDRADQVGRAHVVELDAARPGLARQHAEDEEHQQQRRAEAQRDEARQDARQHEQRAEQNAEADGVERGHGRVDPQSRHSAPTGG